MKTETYADSIL